MQNNQERQSILIVDDSLFTRKRVRQILQEDGFVTVEAANGFLALTAMDREPFACILTDLVMPELDGFGLLEEIRQRRILTPVLVLSADVQQTTRDRCEELGASGFMQKPVNSDTLRQMVASIIGRC